MGVIKVDPDSGQDATEQKNPDSTQPFNSQSTSNATNVSEALRGGFTCLGVLFSVIILRDTKNTRPNDAIS